MLLTEEVFRKNLIHVILPASNRGRKFSSHKIQSSRSEIYQIKLIESHFILNFLNYSFKMSLDVQTNSVNTSPSDDSLPVPNFSCKETAPEKDPHFLQLLQENVVVYNDLVSL